jgi:F-type H+-transporting ATPase subunit b
LTYFLYTPLLRILNEREEKIKKGIADAEDAARAKAQALDEKQAVLTEAQAQAQAIDARAQAFGKEKEAELLALAHAKAQEVLTDAESKSAQLKEKALKDSEAEIAKIAILAAQKVLQG